MGGIFREQLNDDCFERVWKIRTQDTRRNYWSVHVLRNDRQWIVSSERQAAGREFIKQNAERVEIGATIDRLAQRLFGRHVCCSADNHARSRDARAVSW